MTLTRRAGRSSALSICPHRRVPQGHPVPPTGLPTPVCDGLVGPRGRLFLGIPNRGGPADDSRWSSERFGGRCR